MQQRQRDLLAVGARGDDPRAAVEHHVEAIRRRRPRARRRRRSRARGSRRRRAPARGRSAGTRPSTGSSRSSRGTSARASSSSDVAMPLHPTGRLRGRARIVTSSSASRRRSAGSVSDGGRRSRSTATMWPSRDRQGPEHAAGDAAGRRAAQRERSSASSSSSWTAQATPARAATWAGASPSAVRHCRTSRGGVLGPHRQRLQAHAGEIQAARPQVTIERVLVRDALGEGLDARARARSSPAARSSSSRREARRARGPARRSRDRPARRPPRGRRRARRRRAPGVRRPVDQRPAQASSVPSSVASACSSDARQRGGRRGRGARRRAQQAPPRPGDERDAVEPAGAEPGAQVLGGDQPLRAAELQQLVVQRGVIDGFAGELACAALRQARLAGEPAPLRRPTSIASRIRQVVSSRLTSGCGVSERIVTRSEPARPSRLPSRGAMAGTGSSRYGGAAS